MAAGGSNEENKNEETQFDLRDSRRKVGGSFAMMEALQNQSLHVYALWSEVGEIAKSHILQPARVNNLNTVQFTSNKFKGL